MKGALEAEDAKAIVTPFLFPATSDGSTFRAAGHAFYGLLPCKLSLAEIEGIHGRDERIREESLESGVRITLRTLQRFLGIIKGE
jgi:acetylornithine deacetylase/succinyl-diaminopimelate desuccinylase-like protein